MTYAELIAAIQSYTENTFPATELYDGTSEGSKAQLDTFIRQTEERIFNTVQFPSLRKNVTGITTGGNKYLSCPTDFLAVYSMAVIDDSGNYEYLLNKDVNFLRAAYPNPSDTGLPRYYATFGPRSDNEAELTFILAPTPNKLYNVELHYFYYPESLTASATGRSWLGDNFSPVLLYGALVEAYTFMKGEADLLQLYNTKFNEALAMAKRLGDGMERGDAYRDGQLKIGVT